MRSLPSRERGLKFDKYALGLLCVGVAPFTGAWIEIPVLQAGWSLMAVAPFTGAWIEIPCIVAFLRYGLVAPFTGAWIEIHACRAHGRG